MTLNDYVDHTGIEEDQLTCLKLVIGAGHGTILREITRLLFGPRTKERTLWISGAANSGKSMFIRCLNQIFASDEVDWRGLYLPISKRTKPEIMRQILSSEEFSFKDAFTESNRAVTKQLMEGRGATVRADLYKQFDTAYKNAIVVVASNKLPASEAQGSD